MPKICMGCMEPYEDKFEICPACGYITGSKAAEALHMEPGSILRERYIVGKVLGFGGFGVTYLGWDALLEQKVAIKEYLPSEFSTRNPGQTHVTVFNGDKYEQFYDGLSKFVEEAQRLAKFHNLEGIVKIFDSFTDNNTAYIIMEYLDGETLAEFLKRQNIIQPDQAVSMLMPVIHSLQTVHEQGIIHRDIAPDNIFLTKDGKVKLIDFGASRFATTSHSRSLTVIIKPGYSPEEQYRSRSDQGSHTDVYAIGATLYRMITGITPPDALERRAFFESKKKNILKPVSRFCNTINENLEAAILNALNVQIEDRSPDMITLESELISEEPVKRRQGNIKKIDILKWPTWVKIAAPIGVLTVAALSILFVLGIIGFDSLLQRDIYIPDGMSRVPSVVSNSMDEAEQRLTNAVLLYSVAGKEYSNLVPANLILKQDINAGSVVVQNTVVQIFISGGAETKTVPDITGMTEDESRKVLEDLGFAVQIEQEYSSLFAENAVISQSTAGDEELEVGATITLLVSKGADPNEYIEQKITIVPNFIGLSYANAQKAAQDAGFMLSIKSREYSSKFEKGVVMSQNVPSGNEIMSGNTVELAISLGIEVIKVADVQFRTEAEARNMLGKQGLTISVSYAKSETVASGIVISQSPAAQTTVDPGAVVSLVVSSGGENFPMPNVVGMDETSARSALSGKGLSVSVTYEKSVAVADGLVMNQSVAANATVNRGASVSITVSSGQDLITVPNVVGQSESAAKSSLSALGLGTSVSEAYSDTAAKGTVISQSPSSGTTQTKNTTVVLTVSKGQEPISVPNVADKTQTVAESTLRNLGFTVIVTEAYSETVPTGSVIYQSPTGGSSVNKGTVVTLTVSKGKENQESLSVPNVVSKTQSAAETVLQNLGFSVSVADAYSETVPIGSVISQSPVGGSSVNKGAVITLTVSMGKESVSESVTVPNVVGQTKANAASALNSSGFNVEYTEAYDDNVPIGSISAQSLKSGSVANKGDLIKLTVSVGKAEAMSIDTDLPASLNLTEKESRQFTATVSPEFLTDKTVKWSSSNSAVVSVNSTGLVIAVSKGMATITAASSTGNRSKSCSVTVIAAIVKPDSVAVSPSTLTLDVNESSTLTATVSPANAMDRTVTWSSSNASVATLSGNGVVTAKAAGTATITATSNADGTKKGTCVVTVKPAQYTVTFDFNGGHSMAPYSPKTVNAGNYVHLYEGLGSELYKEYCITFVHYDYSGKTYVRGSFLGWYTLPSGGLRIYDSFAPTGNTTLYAQYENPSLEGYLSTPPTRDGYIFEGWFTAENGGSQLTSSTMVTGDMTIYAHWKAENSTDKLTKPEIDFTPKSPSVTLGSTVNISIRAQAAITPTVSNPYVIWIGFSKRFSWDYEDSFYFEGGSKTVSYTLDPNKIGLPSGEYTMAVGLFNSNNFSTGQNIAEAFGSLTVKPEPEISIEFDDRLNQNFANR